MRQFLRNRLGINIINKKVDRVFELNELLNKQLEKHLVISDNAFVRAAKMFEAVLALSGHELIFIPQDVKTPVGATYVCDSDATGDKVCISKIKQTKKVISKSKK